MTNPFKELHRPHRFKAFYGGRGSGKSYNVARALISIASRFRIRVLCCREFQNSIKDSSYLLLKDTAEALGVSQSFRFLESEIRHANGSTFILRVLHITSSRLSPRKALISVGSKKLKQSLNCLGIFSSQPFERKALKFGQRSTL